jgi:hypothetical protein
MLREDLEGISRPVPLGLCLTTFDSKMMVATAHKIPLVILGISSHVKLGLLTGIVA